MVSDEAFLNFCLIIFFLLPAIFMISESFKSTRYARDSGQGTGRTIPVPLAWFFFESPTLWFTILLFPLGKYHSNPKAMINISFFLIHYFHRTIIYPIMLFLKSPRRKISDGYPVSIAAFGFAFNLLNTYLQVRSATEYSAYEDDNWFCWRVAGGLVVYIIGMGINVTSDYALLNLKLEAGGGYKIPRGGLFELVSCPNYFGEIIEWFGWAMVAWSWASFGFFLNTFAILIPRGIARHKWYMEKFRKEYPENRKAVLPFAC